MKPVCVLKSRRFPLSSRDATDGGTLNALRIVETLLDAGVEVEAFTRREDEQSARDTCGRLTVHRVDWQSSNAEHPMQRDYDEGASFVQGVLAHPMFWPFRYRAIHVHHWTSAVGLPERLPTQSMLIYTPHLLAVEKARILGRSCPDGVLECEGRILARAQAVLALSRAEASAISALAILEQEPILAPNGVDPVFFDLPRPGRRLNAPIRLLSIARLTAQKGLDQLLDALEIVLARGLEVELTVVGGSYHDFEYERKLRERAETLPLHERVRFVGPVPHAQIGEWLACSDIYVQPSRYESQGIAILEAMAAGLPVIASRLEGVCEYLDEGYHGLMFTAGDTGELADRIETLIRMPHTSDQLSAAARAHARTFVWTEMQSEVIRRLCKHNSASSTGETHDSLLAARLKAHANERARELAQNPHVLGVLLVGSVVSGPVEVGSDVDLYVLSNGGETNPIAPSWRFIDGNTIENVHVLPISHLDEGHALIGSDQELTEWFYQNPFGDHLARAELLVWTADPSRKDYMENLVTERRRVDIWPRLALRYLRVAATLTRKARDMLATGAFQDAHQILRESSQHTLIAAMVALGWTLRGAKKRPEIASGFLPDARVEAALDLVLDVVGLRVLSMVSAATLCDERLRLRALFVAELRRLANRFPGAQMLLEQASSHERNAVDYYRQSVSSYLVRGPLNHIRCLSGFSTIPAKLLAAIGQQSNVPIGDFLVSESLSTDFRDNWSRIAALESVPIRVHEWLKKAEVTHSLMRDAYGKESL